MSCNSHVEISCNPVQPVQHYPSITGMGACGTQQVRRVIGNFEEDVNLAQLFRMYQDRVQNDCDFGSDFGALLPLLLVFNSKQIKLTASAQNNQICAFEIDLAGLAIGAGSSHWSSVPVYCNIVQQFPSFGIYLDYSGIKKTQAFSWPQTTGQYNLQYNPALNPAAILGFDVSKTPVANINMLALLQRISIPRGTPIYALF
jgi:hypothetical protein